ncbi:MAG: redoxin domain-containing protein [Chryseosolibacter sp.]
MRKTLLSLLMLAGTFADTEAQTVQNFQLVNVLNNQTISLDTYPSCQGMVLIFTSNSCPYDEYYRNRITQLAQSYQDRVPVILVNAHTEPNETAEKMAEKARQLNLKVPYLADKDQKLMTDLNVRKSPEVLLLKNDNGRFSVVYRGAIDDNAQVEADVRHHYLRDAIDIMLTNQKIETPEVRPVGCNLKKKT